ncbi:MAG: hypothetical protein QW728_06390, partial [Thermoplasmata archaeon]
MFLTAAAAIGFLLFIPHHAKADMEISDPAGDAGGSDDLDIVQISISDNESVLEMRLTVVGQLNNSSVYFFLIDRDCDGIWELQVGTVDLLSGFCNDLYAQEFYIFTAENFTCNSTTAVWKMPMRHLGNCSSINIVALALRDGIMDLAPAWFTYYRLSSPPVPNASCTLESEGDLDGEDDGGDIKYQIRWNGNMSMVEGGKLNVFNFRNSTDRNKLGDKVAETITNATGMALLYDMPYNYLRAAFFVPTETPGKLMFAGSFNISPVPSFLFQGFVIDNETNTLLNGANVLAAWNSTEINFSGITSGYGNFQLKLALGNWTITVYLEGYYSYRQTIEITGNTTFFILLRRINSTIFPDALNDVTNMKEGYQDLDLTCVYMDDCEGIFYLGIQVQGVINSSYPYRAFIDRDGDGRWDLTASMEVGGSTVINDLYMQGIYAITSSRSRNNTLLDMFLPMNHFGNLKKVSIMVMLTGNDMADFSTGWLEYTFRTPVVVPVNYTIVERGDLDTEMDMEDFCCFINWTHSGSEVIGAFISVFNTTPNPPDYGQAGNFILLANNTFAGCYLYDIGSGFHRAVVFTLWSCFNISGIFFAGAFDLTPQPTCYLNITVADGDTGTGIPGAEVVLKYVDLPLCSAIYYTSTDGKVSIRIYQGNFTINVAALGYEPAATAITIDAARTLRIPLYFAGETLWGYVFAVNLTTGTPDRPLENVTITVKVKGETSSTQSSTQPKEKVYYSGIGGYYSFKIHAPRAGSSSMLEIAFNSSGFYDSKVEIAPGDIPVLGSLRKDISLRPLPDGTYKIKGYVRYDSGSAASFVLIGFYNMYIDLSAITHTDSLGYYECAVDAVLIAIASYSNSDT